VIKEVEKMLRASIGSSSRDFFDRYFKHTFRITRSLVTGPIKKEVQEVIAEFHKWEASRLRQPDLGDNFSTLTHFPDADIDLAVKLAIDDNLLNKTLFTSHLTAVTKKKDMPTVVQVNQHELRVDFEKGMIVKKRGDVAKGSKGEYQTAFNAALTKAYRDARADAFDLLRYPYSSTGHSDAPGQLAGKSQGPRRGSAAKIKSGKNAGKPRRDGFTKGHGKARAKGDMIVASGTEQTTVARLALADEWDSIRRGAKVKKGKYQDQVMKMVDQVRDEIMDALDVEYKVTKLTKDGKGGGGIDDTIIVNMHATDAKGNKALQHYDSQGIRKFISQKAADIQRDMTSKMAHLEPDLSQSPTKRKRLVGQVNKKLVMGLLGLKGFKGNPDMRLKVNKKLLKEAKLQARQSAKGTGGTNSTKTTTRKAGRNIGSAVALAKGSQRRARKSKNTSKTMESPIALRNLLNEMLPQMVASKMTPPALQYRTGRFANSARVENVNIGPRGGTHIDYTYMKAPYETFEPGGKQGSTQRDPRKIIGASIRELAMGIIGRQPTTIRRN